MPGPGRSRAKRFRLPSVFRPPLLILRWSPSRKTACCCTRATTPPAPARSSGSIALGSALAPWARLALSREPSISPDEKVVAFRRSTGSTSDIWLRSLSRGTDTRFTFDTSSNLDPSWSPKGDRVVFNSNRGGPWNLYQTSGSGQDELLLSTTYTKVPDQWSRDGRFIVYSEQDPKTKHD